LPGSRRGDRGESLVEPEIIDICSRLVAMVPWNGSVMPRCRPHASTNPTARATAPGGSSARPKGERQVEQDLGAGLALDLGKQRFVDREHQVRLIPRSRR
jgi:hypothetical protein